MEMHMKGLRPESRWVALDIKDESMIAQGKGPEEVIREAEETGKEFAMMFIFNPKVNYIL